LWHEDYFMTYLEVVFRYGAAPGENALRAIDGMREVYGVRAVRFNDRERTVRVEFDASRLKAEGVARLLRQAGIDVREPMALA
jgi:selenocysteine lyase/cysteine desulfurase